jgi:hypothetical protein
MENRDREREIIKPLLVLANRNEKVNSKTAKNKTKNAGMAPNIPGSTK